MVCLLFMAINLAIYIFRRILFEKSPGRVGLGNKRGKNPWVIGTRFDFFADGPGIIRTR